MATVAQGGSFRVRDIGAVVWEAPRDRQIACLDHAYEFSLDRQEITDWKWRFVKTVP